MVLKYLSVTFFLLAGLCRSVSAQKRLPLEDELLQSVFKYKESHSISSPDTTGAAYIKFVLITARRNPTLMCIPTMFAVSRGNRSYIGESYNKIEYKEGRISDFKRIAEVGTIPYNRETMPTMVKFITPHIYDVTIYDDHTISPLNRKNYLYYQYYISYPNDSTTRLEFVPKINNVQLVEGWADVENFTGRVTKMEFKGHYDMTKYNVKIDMNDEINYPLCPKKCIADITFSFLGNIIYSQYYVDYMPWNEAKIPHMLKNERKQMEELRSVPLTDLEHDIYVEYDSLKALAARKKKPQTKKWHKVLWNSIGDNLLSRHKGSFGTEDQGSFRLSPILNPLYLGYSHRKGITYKFNLRMSYVFSQKYDISMMFKGGYSFKQHQFYFRVPITFTYNKKHNGYIQFELGNGNRIVNSEILDAITNSDSIKNIADGMEHFRDFNIKLVNHYDFNDNIGFEAGLIMHRRSAVNSEGFHISGKPDEYYSLAPLLQLQFRPLGYKGPILTIDYERNIKGFGKTNTEYERIEGDVSYKYHFHKLRSLSFRLGGGIYTARSKDAYFLDYVNFKEENIVGGWNDDWACEFQLLSSAYYNASKYYLRFNNVYESPIFAVSRIPFIGRYIENERIYNNILFLHNLHTYVENGYGFTTRVFSMGMFIATANGRFHGFGCRFGFELFSKW